MVAGFDTDGLADLHVHTNRSDGVDPPAAVVEHALGRCELDVVAITDHDTITGAVEAASYAGSRGWSDRLVVGEEVSTLEGHVLGLFLESPISPGLSAAATVQAIRDQGGVAVAAHPFWGCSRHRGVGTLIGTLGFDGVEVAHGGLLPDMRRANREAEAACAQLGLAAVGGRDRALHRLGCDEARGDGLMRIAVVTETWSPAVSGVVTRLRWRACRSHSSTADTPGACRCRGPSA